MGDLDSNPGQEAQDLLDKTAQWTERIYDMTKEEIEKYFSAKGEECNRILYIEYSYIQIGKDEQWFKNISAKIGDSLTVRREILLQRLHGSSLSPYPQEDIEYIVSTEKKPIDELWLLDFYKFDIYRKLNKTIPYLVGIDCATGTNGDNNAITIINPYTLEPDAEFECSYIGETMFEKLIIELATYLPKAVIIIERNSVGDGIVDHLMHSKILPRLYYDRNKDLLGDKLQKDESVESMLKKSAKEKTLYGVWTGSKSRPAMFDILSRHVNEYKEKFITHNIIRDLSRLVRFSSGKVAAMPGKHDDSIMSYLIALYVYYHGNNLELFGIRRGIRDEELNNSGLLKPSDIDERYLPEQVVEVIKDKEKKEKFTNKELNWEKALEKATIVSQQQSYAEYKAGLLNGTIFESTPDTMMGEDYDDAQIPDSFFIEMNQ